MKRATHQPLSLEETHLLLSSPGLLTVAFHDRAGLLRVRRVQFVALDKQLGFFADPDLLAHGAEVTCYREDADTDDGFLGVELHGRAVQPGDSDLSDRLRAALIERFGDAGAIGGLQATILELVSSESWNHRR